MNGNRMIAARMLMGLGGTCLSIGLLLLLIKIAMWLAVYTWAIVAGAGLVLLVIGWAIAQWAS